MAYNRLLAVPFDILGTMRASCGVALRVVSEGIVRSNPRRAAIIKQEVDAVTQKSMAPCCRQEYYTNSSGAF